MKGDKTVSLENVQTIIGRAITEAEYRELLFSDPDKALEGYELTEEEAAGLKGLEREKFDAVASELEERISRAGGLRQFIQSGPEPTLPEPFLALPLHYGLGSEH
jgi:hypothetical protein